MKFDTNLGASRKIHRLQIKHGEGFGLPMLPKNGVERVWAALGRVISNHEKGSGFFMIPKTEADRVWRRFKAHLNNFLLWFWRLGNRSPKARHLTDDMGVCVFWVCPTTPMSSAGTISRLY